MIGDEVDPTFLKKGDHVYVLVRSSATYRSEGIVFEVKDSKQWKGDWYIKLRAFKRSSGKIISNQERRSIDFIEDVYRSTATFYRAV